MEDEAQHEFKSEERSLPLSSTTSRAFKLEKILCILSAITVFFTTNALMMPVVTMERNPDCGQEAHTHDDSCYGSVAVLVCREEEREPHAHTDACLEKEKTLTCTIPEHVHTDACYESSKAPAETPDPAATPGPDPDVELTAEPTAEVTPEGTPERLGGDCRR